MSDDTQAVEGPNWVRTAKHLLGGTTGGIAGVITGHPLDTVRVRMQHSVGVSDKYGSIWSSIRQIVMKESPRALFKGMASPLAGIAFQNAMTFGAYGVAIDYLNHRRVTRAQSQGVTADAQPTIAEVGIAGSFAGAAVTYLTGPVELVKIRMQVQENALGSGANRSNGAGVRYKGSFDCARAIWREQGSRGLMRGIAPTFWREWPATGSYFASYEWIKRSMTPEGEEASHATLLFAGGIAGIISWVITYPFDIIKTRIQESDRRMTMKESFQEVVRVGGVRALFAGQTAAIVRAFPVNGACFWMYEITMKLLDDV